MTLLGVRVGVAPTPCSDTEPPWWWPGGSDEVTWAQMPSPQCLCLSVCLKSIKILKLFLVFLMTNFVT